MNYKYKTATSKVINHLNGFHTIEKEWREVYEDSSKSPFLSFEFIDLWYRCFAAPHEVVIYRAFEGDRTIGFWPLRLQRKCGIRCLSSLTNDHCLHGEPLMEVNKTEVFQRSIIESLLAHSALWDILCHRFSYSFSELPGFFSDGILRIYEIVGTRNIQPTYSVIFDKTFEAYFREDLSSNVRKNFMRYRNRLRRSADTEFRCYRNFEAIDHWAKFVAIEDSGWKGKAQSSIKKASNSYTLYYNRLLEFLAQNDALYLYFLELGSRPIAGAFGYVDGTTFHWAKTGYDENYREFSPANILLLYIIEHLMTSVPAVKRFHMFPWDHGYKHRYVNERSDCIDTVLYSPTIRGRAMYNLSQMKRGIRNTLPEILGYAMNIVKLWKQTKNTF